MAADLDIGYGCKTRPSALVNSLFMSTVNVAAKSLVSVASNIKTEHKEKWRASDHLRFMVMLMSWVTVWVLRVLMDLLPCPTTCFPHNLLGGFSPIGAFNFALPAPSATSRALSSSLYPTSCSSSSMELILQQDYFDGPSVQALTRALTHVLALLNDVPATSRKYQFTMAMADNIMEGNFRDSQDELMEINRSALSSAFARTLSLLYSKLQQPEAPAESGWWTTRIIRILPWGSYIATCVKGLKFCVRTVMQAVGSGSLQLDKRGRKSASSGGSGRDEDWDDVVAEKHAQELLWITNKLRVYGAVDEAMAQWSFASGLASIALVTNPRVQGLIVKISAILIGDLPQVKMEISSQVKFRLLALWIPLLCYANNGLAYPVLSSFEKMEVERAMDQVLSTLPVMDQEVILTNWLQDFTVSASEWPNLQLSYDRWCQSTRELVAEYTSTVAMEEEESNY